jgi:quinohemoprotein ethanol dehydrogenase
MDGRGSLLAWDPVKQNIRWRVDYPSYMNAGTVTTAGNLVFQGTNTGKFRAYAADTGKRLWEFDAKHGIIAPPITYSVKGRQYVSLLVGYGAMAGIGGPLGGQGRNQGWKHGLQPRRLLTFMLDGTAKLPDTPPPDLTVLPLDDPSLKLDASKVSRGHQLYGLAGCLVCHGAEAYASGGAPDLRESAVALDPEAFRTVLREGALAPRGMPQFDDLTDDEIEDLYQFIRAQARSSGASH